MRPYRYVARRVKHKGLKDQARSWRVKDLSDPHNSYPKGFLGLFTEVEAKKRATEQNRVEKFLKRVNA